MGRPGRQDAIHYYHLLLSRGVQAGKMSFIINCEDAFYWKKTVLLHSTILIFNYLSYTTGSFYTS